MSLTWNVRSIPTNTRSSGVGTHKYPFKLLKPPPNRTVSAPAERALASVPQLLAALVVEPAMALATVPMMDGTGVVAVYVPNVDARRPHWMPNCWDVAVPPWLTSMRRISSNEARLAQAVAARSVMSSAFAMMVWSTIG